MKWKNYVNKFLFEIITKNPQTDFYIIIPTLSRFFWKMPNQPSYHRNRTAKQFFAEYKIMLKWFVKESEKYKNTKIYGFEDLDYPDKITNYRDGAHHKSDMNSV